MKIKNNKKILLLSSLIGIGVVASFSTLGILLTKNKSNTPKKTDNKTRETYMTKLGNSLKEYKNNNEIQPVLSRILEQYPYLNNESEYISLNKNIESILASYETSSKVEYKFTNLEVNYELENKIKHNLDRLNSVVNQKTINFANYSLDLANNSKTIITDIDKIKENQYNLFKTSLEQNLESLNTPKFVEFKKNLLNSYPHKTNSDEYLVLNDSLSTFSTLLNEYLKINLTRLEEGVSVKFSDDEKLNNSKEFFDNIASTNTFNFNDLNQENNEKLVELISLSKIKNKLILDNNAKMNLYVSNLDNYDFKNQTTKDIYLQLKSKAYDNPTTKRELIEKLLETDKKITNIKSIFDNYNFTNILPPFEAFFSAVVSDFNEDNNFSLFEESLNELKLKIKENNLQSTEEGFEAKKQEALNKIKDDQNLSADSKNELKVKIENSFTMSELSEILETIFKHNGDFKEKEEELNNLIKNSLIDTDIKNDLVIITSQLNDYFKFDTFLTKFKELVKSLETLSSKINEFKSNINSGTINGKKEYEFYLFLNKNRKIFKNNSLKTFDLSNMDSNIDSVKNLLTELETVESLVNPDNKTATEYLKDNTESVFNLENYEGETKYNLDSIKNAGSFNFGNANIFFDHFDTDKFNFTIKDLKLTGEALNTLEVTIEAKIKGVDNFSYTFKKSKEYTNGALAEYESITLDTIDSLFNVNYELLNSYTKKEFNALTNEQKEEIFVPKNYGLNKYFKYNISDIFVSFGKVYGYVNVLFNNQILKSAQLNTERNFQSRSGSKEEYWDKINEKKILDIIHSNSKADFFLNVTLKDPKVRWNHSDFIASQAKEKMTKYYQMPKFGKYEIYIDEVTNVKDQDHKANIKLWYTIDGVVAPKPATGLKNQFEINDFMFLKYEDIKPKGEKFTENDFKGEGFTIEGLSSDHKNLMDKINESSLGWNLGMGTVERKGSETVKIDYRTLNPVSLLKQKAYNKLNYFISIKVRQANQGEYNLNGTTRDKAVKGELLDGEDFIGVENRNKIYNKDVEVVNDDLFNLLTNYFYYFYDLELVGRRGLNFKIGWINKNNNNIRYTNGKVYSLINLVNDYEQALYPEIMLNNIKLSDLTINNSIISSHDLNYFISHKDELNNAIALKDKDKDGFVSYNDFKIKANRFKVNNILKLNNDEAYVQLKVEGYDPAHNVAKDFIGKSWYKISGFSSTEKGSNATLNLYDQFRVDKSSNLITVYNSENEIIRKRLIEPYWKDVFWNYDKKEQNVYWYLDKKYLEKTLLENTTTSSTLDFIIHANVLLNDSNKSNRITNSSEDNRYSINFNKLKEDKVIIFNKHVNSGTENSFIDYKVIFKWEPNKGIKVIIDTNDKNNKIVINDPDLLKFQDNKKFDSEKAIVVLPAASEVIMTYTSSLEHEDFKIESNKFDYNDTFYTDNNQPIMFSNDTSYLKNNEVYYPNQNVPYKLHEGYLMDLDVINWNKQDDWELVKDTWMRSVQFLAYTRPKNWDWSNGAIGSTSIIGKVNDDINDHKYYLITNRHVIGDNVHKFNEIPNNTWNYGLNLGSKFRDNYISRYWDYFQKVSWKKMIDKIETDTDVFWTGLDQKNENEGGNDLSKIDMTIFVADFNKQYNDAKRDGKMNIVYKLDYINKYIGEVKFNVDYQKGYVSVPANRNIASIGYPHGQMSGIINRRPWPSYTHEKDDQIGIGTQSNYAPVYLGKGGSGTSLYLDDNTYFATWWGGNKGYDSYAFRYLTKQYNLMGTNINNQNPFDVKNIHSFASQILRANLKDPNGYRAPWFYENNYNNEEEDNE
ncbi:MGA_1079 family surface serine endopeptidase [Mycoplasma sp. OR1901]|uniref:MGA_1079 family surface serine endopeptidase n=1 Tax=Mycoplasma sp. OR1901 TaxID=2742195 RepID=UPI0015822447|nr:hypothetical protein [Mycoplasma sp. OR1901]QKT05462.1 hypothetical protein HTZ87_01960 [Mycoplasma sp. OR1901]